MDGSRHQCMPTSNKKQRCFGFINKAHIDKCDLVKKQDSDKWFISLNSIMVKKITNKKYMVAKLKLINNVFEIGLPTTCGYSIVYGGKQKYNTYMDHMYK